jgi:cell division protein FtsZ
MEYDAVECSVIIKVVGIGGGGGRAVDNMIESGLEGVEFLVVDIDAKALSVSQAKKKLQLGGQQRLIKRSNTEVNLEIGRTLALKSAGPLSEYFAGADLVFVVVGMGGETGTSAALVAAQLAQEAGALVLGVATKPFDFEGPRKMLVAKFGIDQLLEHVDSLITISNENFLESDHNDLTEVQSFKKVDDAMSNAVQCVSGLVAIHGPMGTDFQDIKTIMKNTGKAMIGIGIASGKDRCVEATQQIITNLQIEDRGVLSACGMLLMYSAANPECMPDMKEISDAIELVIAEIIEDCDIVFGVMYDESLGDNLQVTAITVNFDGDWPIQRLEVDVTIEGIIQTVSDYYEISTEELLLYDKNKNTLLPRQIAMYLSRCITEESYPEIGCKFGGKHHATIMYACKKVEKKSALDNEFLVAVENLKKIITRRKNTDSLLGKTIFTHKHLLEL